jgi:hypothetical protein
MKKGTEVPFVLDYFFIVMVLVIFTSTGTGSKKSPGKKSFAN